MRNPLPAKLVPVTLAMVTTLSGIDLPTPLSTVSFFEMSTFAEIKAAAQRLPTMQQEKLFAFLAGRLHRKVNVGTKARRALDAAAYPPLEGLPADLSVGTKESIRALLAKRHAADR